MILFLFLASVAALLVFVIFEMVTEHRRVGTYPTSWVHIGTPSKNVEIALEVIWKNRPDPSKEIRWGGEIVWVDTPFFVGCILATGRVSDTDKPTLIVCRIEPVEKSSLTHEVGHYLWLKTFDRLGEVWEGDRIVLDPDFAAWVSKTNGVIAKALGR